MVSLTDENKKKFQKQVEKINQKDETKVKQNIAKEIDELEVKSQNKSSQKLKSLLRDAKLLHQILLEEEFPISDSSRKWVVFGLGYLVSDVDLIPDNIPAIGYLDDAMILSWVLNIINDEVTRFKKFQEAKFLGQGASVVQIVKKSDANKFIILIPGFLANPLETNENDYWSKIIQNMMPGNESVNIGIVNWPSNYLKEFSKTIGLMDHKLNLKPVYDHESFGIEWQQIKLDMAHIGNQLAKEIQELKDQQSGLEISIMAINTGAITALNAADSCPENTIEALYIYGGSITEAKLLSYKRTMPPIYNFFSIHDYALQFIHNNYEEQQAALGCAAARGNKDFEISNIDVSNMVTRHNDYKYKLTELYSLFLKKQ